jgi:replicative DNA helicase
MADQDGPQQRPLRIEEGGAFPLSKFTGGRGRSRANVVALHEQAGRVPPQAVDVEQSVLGAMLIEREAIPKAIEILPSEAFYDGRHQRIYQAILGLFERGNPVDLITLTEELKRRGDFENIGGYYLSELTTRVASAANVEYHARIIAEKSLLRQMIETMTTTVGEAYDPSTDAFDLLDRAERDIFQISESQLRKGSRSMSEVVMETFKQLEALSHRDGGITGVPSGFHALDDMTGGWQKSDLIIIAARPSMGKTAFSLATAMNAATHPQYGVGVAIFSLEMSANQLAQRMLTSEARIDAQKARTGRLTDEDWPLLARAAGRLEAAKIFVDDTPGLGILELRAKCRRLKAEHDIGLVIVDYLQLMHGTRDSRNSNREQEIAQISRSLKALAKEIDVPVIALAQLSRAVETRGGDKRPQLSDLRESGCLTGDTLVTRADTGARVPLRDLARQHPDGGFPVWAVDLHTLKLEASPVSRAFSTGTKPVFRLTTRLGRTVRATANHKFLTVEGWRRLDELSVGEHLALPRRIEQPSAPTMSLDELALLGHLIGDGCTLPRHVIQYSTRELDLAEHVADLATRVFGDDVAPRLNREHDRKRGRSWIQVYLTSTRHHTHGNRSAVSEWLDALGAWGLRSHEKRVPPSVFQQPADHIAHFLRHLWATDGCIRMRGGKRPHPAVYYATSSRRLGEDVQALLLRVGVRARLKRIPQGEKGRDQHHVIVSGRPDLLRFAEAVGAVGCYKQEALAEVRAHLAERDGNTNRDVIPRSVWARIVVPAMARAELTTRQMQAGLGMSYCGSTLYRTNLSRVRAARVAEVVGSLTLARLAESDLYWDEIVAVEPDGVEEVFDLTVPGPHNFVAGDVVVHNSIEQDADVVAFIYRAERYGITQDENGNSTAGLGEIIIGKQRNGPIGNVRLAFVNQYARFENLTTYYGSDPGFEYNAGGAAPPPLPGAGGGYDDYEELPPPGDAPF